MKILGQFVDEGSRGDVTLPMENPICDLDVTLTAVGGRRNTAFQKIFLVLPGLTWDF
jgi:hypothetical protein